MSDYMARYPFDYPWIGVPGVKRVAEIPMDANKPAFSTAEVTKLIDQANKAGRDQGEKAAQARIDNAKDAWIIISRFGSNLMPASNPRVYASKAQALAVAHKLAEASPETDFIVLRYVAVVRAPKPVVQKTAVTTI